MLKSFRLFFINQSRQGWFLKSKTEYKITLAIELFIVGFWSLPDQSVQSSCKTC